MANSIKPSDFSKSVLNKMKNAQQSTHAKNQVKPEQISDLHNSAPVTEARYRRLTNTQMGSPVDTAGEYNAQTRNLGPKDTRIETKKEEKSEKLARSVKPS